jgi:hypothetical protein
VPSQIARRRVLVLADQAASSLSNVVVAVLVARSFPEEVKPFAAFSLAIMVFQFLVGCVRGLVFEPLLASYSDRPAAERRALVPGYLGATVAVGAVVAALVAVSSIGVGDMAGSALLALAVVLPLVLVQDAWRHMFVIDRPGAALAIDLVWLGASCGAIVLAPDGVGVGWYVIAWGAGGALGAALATALGRRSLGRLRAWSYLVRNRVLGLRFLGEYVTAQAGNYVALLACGWMLGLTAYGAVRAGNFYFGPLFTLQAGVILSVLPEGTRLRDRPDQLARLIYGATALVVVATLAWTVVGLVAPDSFGRALFGATWAEADDLLLPIGLAVAGMAVVTGGLVGVRSLDGTKGLGARLRTIPFQLVCPIVGGLVGDVMGFAVGMAVGQVVSAGVWWRTFLRLLTRQRIRLLAGAIVAPSEGAPTGVAAPPWTGALATAEEI